MTDPNVPPVIDVEIDDQGSVWLFVLNTSGAQDWVAEHVDVPSYMWLGDHSFAADWRMAREIALGMKADGLTLR